MGLGIRFLNHSRLHSKREDSTRLDNRPGVAQWLEVVFLARAVVGGWVGGLMGR